MGHKEKLTLLTATMNKPGGGFWTSILLRLFSWASGREFAGDRAILA